MEAFPWRNYTNEELITEFNRLEKKINEPITIHLGRSYIGYPCSNYFFQKQRLSTSKYRCISSVEYWKKKTEDQKASIQQYSLDHNGDCFRGIVSLSHTPAQFPVVAAGKLYVYFKASCVFDPYAGWGDRCLAAMATNIDYIGVDSNHNLLEPYDRMIKTFIPYTESSVKMIYQKSEDVDIKDLKFDLVFTSPPFWTQDQILLENYADCETDYSTFLLTSLIPMFRKCSQRNIWICLHLPQNMYNDLVPIVGECNKQIGINSSTRPHNIGFRDIVYCWEPCFNTPECMKI